MRPQIIICLAFAISSVVDFGSSQDQDRTDTESEIRRILEAQVQAWNSGDIDRFMEAYWKSPGLTFSSGGKVVRGWQATLERYKSRYSTRDAMGQLTFDNFEFRLLAPEAALVLGNWHLERGNNSIGGNFSLVLRHMDSEWKIVHDHTSTLEDESE